MRYAGLALDVRSHMGKKAWGHGDTDWKKPYVTSLNIIDEAVANFVDSMEPTRAIHNVGPLA